jgi:K+-transporting ATPase A subunit
MLMEKPRPRDRLSWAVTVVCCLYIVWVTHFFASNIPAVGSLFAGLGARTVPWISTAVVAVSGGFFPYIAAAILIGGLIAKERSRLGRDAKITDDGDRLHGRLLVPANLGRGGFPAAL